MTAKIYCPSCGIDVEPFVLTGAGEEVIHCSICGLVLDSGAGADAPSPAPTALSCVVIAEDTESIRNAVATMLKNQGIAKDVITAENGIEFVSHATGRLKEGKPISLAILDVEMPLMNGVQGAMSLREIEKQFGAKRKTPVLFFTSRKCDEKFKQVLQRLQPSSYVNKGASTNPADLAKRVNKVLTVLLQGGG